MSAPAVTARGVAFSYGERRALGGVDFDVAAGSAFGFLGPNGSGKSTLFRVLSTIVPPQQGTVSVLGLDLGREPAAVRQRIGVVFQSPAVDRKLTVRENLRYGGRLYGLSGAALERRADELLEVAEMRDRAGDRVEELSGGLRRRVEIQKALLHRPQLVLLDEASTGLDPAARRDMWALLRRQHGITVLFTTHLMDEAAEADRLVLLDGGMVVGAGTPDELMRKVGGQVLEVEAEAAVLVEVRKHLGGDAQELDGVVRLEGERVHDRVPPLIDAFGDRLRRVSVAHPSLADVFLHLTGKRFVVKPPEPEARGRRRRR
ncbi:MAG: ABC transporter ATP-binding protein [Planctomycetota bacterium]